jgi:pyruvate formate-lyase activating enzyme-like uncharacterized protein
MIKLQRGSATTKPVPEGCSLCALGGKMVLFVTGLCSHHCYYCPLSEQKKNLDVIYADEMPVTKDKDIIDEAKLISALGTGITGGDPLIKLGRTLRYINLLKDEFGEKHHIHLYTVTGSKEAFKKLKEAGLDDLRIHVPEIYWDRLKSSGYADILTSAVNAELNVGIEVPVIPHKEKELLTLIKVADSLNVRFINLNELEFSDTNWQSMKLLNFETKSYISTAVKGSQATALKVLNESDADMIVHYCSAAFKDGIQMKNRLKRRAKNVAKGYEIITKDSTLLRGEIYTDTPERLALKLIKKYDISKKLIEIAQDKIYIAPWILEKIAKELDEQCYITEVYPTWDQLEVEKINLKTEKL